jgi:hypothetical protein
MASKESGGRLIFNFSLEGLRYTPQIKSRWSGVERIEFVPVRAIVWVGSNWGKKMLRGISIPV